MEIFALEGHRVKVTEETIKNGDSGDQQMVKENLEIEKIYTIRQTVVHNYHTNVYLKEVPGGFNSVMFEDVDQQSEEISRHHPDWARYNY